MNAHPGLLDTDPHPVFTTYSAGNFGEVAPDRLSPLSWSVVGVPVERALRRIVRRIWPGARWASGSHAVFVGYFSCKPYHNLSALGRLADYVPGVTAADVSRSYFEGAAEPVSAGVRVPRREQAAALPRLARAALHARGEAVRVEEEATELESAVAAAADHPGLLPGLLPRALALVDDAWEVHYLSTLALVPLVAAQSAIADRLIPYWSELEPLVNQPRELVWPALADLGRIGGGLTVLAHPFYEIAETSPPWDRFAHAVGSVGTTNIPTEDRPDLWGPVPFARPAMLPQITAAVCTCLSQRELTKSVAMRSLNIVRHLLPAMAEARQVDPAWVPYLTIDEINDPTVEVTDLKARACERSDCCAQAVTMDLPTVLETGPTPPTPAPQTGPRVGVGVCPGQVEGRVVRPADLVGGSQPARAADSMPRVLACESADVGVHDLLSLVDAVVTGRGSALSHLAILLRERGLPAVLGHPDVADLRSGQRVHVNGSTGEVIAHEREDRTTGAAGP